MIISLGNRFPGTRATYPEVDNGSGRPAHGIQDGVVKPVTRPHGTPFWRTVLLPYLVLLPVGFAEPAGHPTCW